MGTSWSCLAEHMVKLKMSKLSMFYKLFSQTNENIGKSQLQIHININSDQKM